MLTLRNRKFSAAAALRDERYWRRVYEAAHLAHWEITLEEFLADPGTILESVGQESAPDCMVRGFRPLLPAQANVARRLRELERAGIRDEHQRLRLVRGGR